MSKIALNVNRPQRGRPRWARGGLETGREVTVVYTLVCSHTHVHTHTQLGSSKPKLGTLLRRLTDWWWSLLLFTQWSQQTRSRDLLPARQRFFFFLKKDTLTHWWMRLGYSESMAALTTILNAPRLFGASLHLVLMCTNAHIFAPPPFSSFGLLYGNIVRLPLITLHYITLAFFFIIIIFKSRCRLMVVSVCLYQVWTNLKFY